MSKCKNRLLIIQPILASYREPLVKALSSYVCEEVVVCADKAGSSFGSVSGGGYTLIEAKWKNIGSIRYLPLSVVRKLFSGFDKCIHFADFKYLSLWLLLVWCFFSKKKMWLHGQGGYKKTGLVHRIVYFFSVYMSEGYICYTKYSSDCLKSILPVFLHKKVSVVENTLDIEPVERVPSRETHDLFYVGRVREDCGLVFLLEAALRAGVRVRVVGSGNASYLQYLADNFSNAEFYGKIFDRDEQLDIAKGCMAGAYGGDAGLSVVHYMAFGLPVIVHSDIRCHMGPEPSYIENGLNGIYFKRGDINSLVEAIDQIKNKELGERLSKGAMDTFKSLSIPSMAEKFLKIMEVEHAVSVRPS